jgi:hypothetical protein
MAKKTTILATLPLDGWVIMDNVLMKIVKTDSDLLSSGIEWHSYPMPDEWCADLIKYYKDQK